MVAFIIFCAGSLGGYRMGLQIEKSQLAEKRFFENTSHELKNPLTAIRGFAEGIETGVITDYQKAGRVIAAQTDQMSCLIEDILYRARIESGSVPLRKEALSAAEAVRDSLMPFEGNITMRGLAVSLELNDLTIMADPDQLDHALSNLITNAIQHAVSRIRITLRDGTLEIWNDTRDADPNAAAHIFDRYYTERNGGTGIGLSLVKSIAENHGWTIRAEAVDSGMLISIGLSE